MKTRSFSPSYIADADSYHPVISLISASNSPVTFAMVATSMPESSDLKAIRRWGSRNNGNEGVAAGLRHFFSIRNADCSCRVNVFFFIFADCFSTESGVGDDGRDGVAKQFEAVDK